MKVQFWVIFQQPSLLLTRPSASVPSCQVRRAMITLVGYSKLFQLHLKSRRAKAEKHLCDRRRIAAGSAPV